MTPKRTVGINCKRKQKIIIDGKVCDITTHGNLTIWGLMKNFINSLEKGSVFTRKELLESVYEIEMGTRMTTVDTYRATLLRSKFIEFVERGKYRKLLNIPESTTRSDLIDKVIMRQKTWKEWFIPLHEMLGVDESEL